MNHQVGKLMMASVQYFFILYLCSYDHHRHQVGKLMMASGGRRQGRALRSVEAMLPDGGKGERLFFFPIFFKFFAFSII